MKRNALAPKQSRSGENRPRRMDRRSFLGLSAAVAGAALAPAVSAGDRDWSGKSPVRYPDPDVIVLEPRFAKYKIGTRRFNGFGPAPYGRRVARGMAPAVTWS